ncbi:LuxR C-terminal-related transcriptional regulator [Gordonia sp. NPDC003424]
MTVSPSDMQFPSAASAHAVPATYRAAMPADHAQASAATARRDAALAQLARRRMPLPPTDATPTVIHLVQPNENHWPAPHRRVTSPAPLAAVTPIGPAAGSPAAPLIRPDLTQREIEVLRTWLLLDSKVLVTQELHIAMGTVNTHLTRIRAKYTAVGRRARTKASLAARALQDGFLSIDEL